MSKKKKTGLARQLCAHTDATKKSPKGNPNSAPPRKLKKMEPGMENVCKLQPSKKRKGKQRAKQ